jgi:predicted esterase
VGFHGYGQSAEDELALLSAIPGSDRWICCSIEALHSFYTPQGAIGASWMTSRHRELRIEENLCYVNGVIARLRERHTVNEQLVFHGFSQGAGMAARSALLGNYRTSGLMMLGGDIPPELQFAGRDVRVHLARGSRDRLYREEQYEEDKARLHDSAIPFSATLFNGGHGAGEEYLAAAGEFLASDFF